MARTIETIADVLKLMNDYDRLDRQLAEAQAKLAASQSAVEGLCQEVSRMGAELAAMDWQPITPEILPGKGDEVINESGYVLPTRRATDSWDAAKWKQNRWTHFRAINPPAKGAADGN